MTLGSVLVRTGAAASSWSAQFDMQWPGADIVVDDMSWFRGRRPTRWERRPERSPRGHPGGRSRGACRRRRQRSTRDGNPIYVEWTDRRLDDPMLAGSVEIIDGRVPRDGEVLLDPAVAAALGLDRR
jgi:hypothetical protein